ncbi:MAG: GNAT family N-acetyltransferase [Promethearchaeota archaeon]
MSENEIPNWRTIYQAKQIEPKDLKSIIKFGSRIFIGTGCSEPLILTRELAEKQHQFVDCEIIHLLTLSDLDYFSSDASPSRFRHNTLSIIASDMIRKAVNAGKSDFTPIKSSEIPQLLKRRVISIDIALLQVSPPDQYGFCSLGTNVDINYSVAQVTKTLIVQINPEMPRTLGNTCIKMQDIDYFVYHKAPLIDYSLHFRRGKNQRYSDDLIAKMGRYFSRLIENRSTLNIGLGNLPPRIWRFLHDKQDLAVYSEVLPLTDDFFQLVQENVINCKKNVYPHIMTSFAIGSPAQFKKLHLNPFFEFHPMEYINNLMNIAKNHKLCSIYSAISVDLTGQITNHLPDSFYSGIGGEPDFIQGSSLSKGGKTIILLPSTTRDGKISRIVPTVNLSDIPACDVHYVVTEWGIARLAGKSIRHRALQLIGVAHPSFRKKLLEEAKELHYIYEDQILPVTSDGVVVIYPEHFEWQFQSKSESIIEFRPVKPTDEALIQRFFYQLDEKSRIYRFLAPRKVFSHEDTQLDVNIDYDTTMMIVGLYGDDKNQDNQEIITIGSYYKDPTGSSNFAEIAVAVASNWQRQGIGRHIFQRMIEVGLEKGVAGFIGEIAGENQAIISIIKNLPYKTTFENYSPEILGFSIDFRDRAEEKGIIEDQHDRYMKFKSHLM